MTSCQWINLLMGDYTFIEVSAVAWSHSVTNHQALKEFLKSKDRIFNQHLKASVQCWHNTNLCDPWYQILPQHLNLCELESLSDWAAESNPVSHSADKVWQQEKRKGKLRREERRSRSSGRRNPRRISLSSQTPPRLLLCSALSSWSLIFSKPGLEKRAAQTACKPCWPHNKPQTSLRAGGQRVWMPVRDKQNRKQENAHWKLCYLSEKGFDVHVSSGF